MSILVAGGCGFIGSHLIKKLVEMEERVIVFDSNPNLVLLGSVAEKVEVVKGDATQMVDILQAIKQYQVKEVYHLIALMADVCQKKPFLALKVNVETLLNFLEAARLMALKKIIFASSVAVYNASEPAPVGDEAPTNPSSIYGATKVAGEYFGLHYHRNFGVDFRALRFTTIYGPGKSTGFTGICGLMIEKSARGEAVQGDFRNAVTDWLYIKDAVNSLLLIRNKTGPSRVYNIGGSSHSVGEVAGIVKKVLPGAQISLEAKQLFPWPPSYSWNRAKTELGYKPFFDIEAGVRDFIAEVR
jgi:nucleoside-diphosphate-sugar epimerase